MSQNTLEYKKIKLKKFLLRREFLIYFEFLTFYDPLKNLALFARPGHFQLLPLSVIVNSSKQWKCPELGAISIRHKKFLQGMETLNTNQKFNHMCLKFQELFSKLNS